MTGISFCPRACASKAEKTTPVLPDRAVDPPSRPSTGPRPTGELTLSTQPNNVQPCGTSQCSAEHLPVVPCNVRDKFPVGAHARPSGRGEEERDASHSPQRNESATGKQTAAIFGGAATALHTTADLEDGADAENKTPRVDTGCLEEVKHLHVSNTRSLTYASLMNATKERRKTAEKHLSYRPSRNLEARTAFRKRALKGGVDREAEATLRARRRPAERT